MMNAVFISTNASAYNPNELTGDTMTVDELRDYLTNFPSDWPVFLSNNGYTYGYISESGIEDLRFSKEEVFH